MDRDGLEPPLDQAALRAELIGTGLGWRRLDVVEQTGSTNADLLARAASGDGRRRRGADRRAPDRRPRAARPRSWSAARGPRSRMSVGVSVVDVPVAGWGWLPLATGVAVVDTVAPRSTGVAGGPEVAERRAGRPPDPREAGRHPRRGGAAGGGDWPGAQRHRRPPKGSTGRRRCWTSACAAPDRHQLVCATAARARQADRRVARRARSRLGAGGRLPGAQPDHRQPRARPPARRQGSRRHRQRHRRPGQAVLDIGDETVVVSAGDVVHLRVGQAS